MRRARPRRAAPLTLAALAVASSAGADDGEPSQEWNAADAAESGNFLPYSESPSTSATYVTTLGGYDTARRGARVAGQLQLRLHSRVYVLAGGEYEGPHDRTFEPAVAVQVIVLEEKDHGVDVAVFGGWEHSGFDTGADALGRVAVAGHFHGAYLLGGAAFGFSSDSRSGELVLGGIREVVPRLYVGVDSRGRKDLEHGNAWDVQAGPAATYVAGMFAVSATAAVSSLREPQVTSDKVGALTMVGVGAVF